MSTTSSRQTTFIPTGIVADGPHTRRGVVGFRQKDIVTSRRLRWECERVKVADSKAQPLVLVNPSDPGEYLPGIKKCRLHLAQTKMSVAQPVTEEQTWFNVLSQVNVNREDVDGVSRFTFAPQWARATDNRLLVRDDDLTGARVMRAGPITYDANGRRLFATSTAGGGGSAPPTCQHKTFLSTGAVAHQCVRSAGASGYCATHTNIGSSPAIGGAAQSSSAGKSAGNVTLPKDGSTGAPQFPWPVLTQADAATFVSVVASGFQRVDRVQNPTVQALLQNLAATQGTQDFVFIVSDDDGYGMVSAVVPKAFAFSHRSKPIRVLNDRERKYLEWLMTINGMLRHDYPEYHLHLLDQAADTIGILETAILTTMGRLETADAEFNRKALFSGWEDFQSLMHPYLKEYASRPPTVVWMSPLSDRYRPAPTGAADFTALEALKARASDIAGAARAQIDDRFVFPVQNPLDFDIMGVVEDVLLSVLARLQYEYNVLVPPTFFASGRTAVLPFAQKELKSYIEMAVSGGDETSSKFIDIGTPLQQTELSMYVSPLTQPVNEGWNPLMSPGAPAVRTFPITGTTSTAAVANANSVAPLQLWRGGRGAGRSSNGTAGRNGRAGGSASSRMAPPVARRRLTMTGAGPRRAGCAPCRSQLYYADA